MHALRRCRAAVFLVSVGACGAPDSGSTTTADTTSGAATGADETAAPVTTSAGGTTHATHDETAADETAVGTTHDTHEHTVTSDAGTTHGTHEHTDSTAGTTGEVGPVEEYCSCMLENCHDQYHALWGEDHRQSEAMCKAAAEAVPSVGMPAMRGDSIECRLYFCSVGHDDPAACESALGADPCQ